MWYVRFPLLRLLRRAFVIENDINKNGWYALANINNQS